MGIEIWVKRADGWKYLTTDHAFTTLESAAAAWQWQFTAPVTARYPA